MDKKRLDKLNFFYSIGAVVILIGVIAKFLEWRMQDILLLTGLSVEALVFGVSSIQFIDNVDKKYKWENVFPELVDTTFQNNESLLQTNKKITSSIQAKMKIFDSLLEENIDSLKNILIFKQEVENKTLQVQEKYEKINAQLNNTSDIIGNTNITIEHSFKNLIYENNYLTQEIKGLQQTIIEFNLSIHNLKNTVDSKY